MASFVAGLLVLSSWPAKKAGESGELIDDEMDGTRCRRPSEKASTTATIPVTRAMTPPTDAPAIMPSSSLDKAASPSSSRNGDDGGDVGGGAEEESGGDEVS